MTQRKKHADKIMIVGIDGMDPKLTMKYMAEGKMPHTKRIIERDVAAKDLFMLGGMPTCTPPMWTSMATGVWPNVHGLNDFSRHEPENRFGLGYGMSSTFVTAEQIWNVTAEAGYKTLVWHWPVGWPPTSDSPNLHVVDGTQPAMINMGVAQREAEFVCAANAKTEVVKFIPKGANDSNIACVITGLEVQESNARDIVAEMTAAGGKFHLIMGPEDGVGNLSTKPFNICVSPIKDADDKWATAPEGAKEFTLLLSEGFIRRSCQIWKNEEGKYDRVAIFKNKKATEPLVVLENNVYTRDVVDDCIENDKNYTVSRNMRVLYIAEDGSGVKIWVSAAMDIENNSVWHPKYLYKKVVENVGYCPPACNMGNCDKQIMYDCMISTWDCACDWTADALNYLIEEEGYEMVFTQLHNIDALGHMFLRHLLDRNEGRLDPKVYEEIMERGYIQTDDYIAKFEHFIDEGWTLLFLSDHAQVCQPYSATNLSDGSGITVPVMRELGYTVIKQDDNGNDIREIDWSKTRAVMNGGGHIYLNLKGRDPEGIVDPADQYELEEQIITDLYSYKHPQTGKRIVSLALRNRDALVLGQGGPNCGDIYVLLAEGYTFDHGDGLPTVLGVKDTSVAPIFFAAGKGLKSGETISRIIRQIDIAPTVSALAGLRMPADCEGAPIYQMFAEEY